jgi:hypothetical protein
LFLGGGFDIEVDKLLAIDDRHPEFLRLGGIEQHAFHVLSLGAMRRGQAEAKQDAPRLAAAARR